MPPKPYSKSGAVSDIARPVRRASLASTPTDVSEDIINELKAAITAIPPPIIIEPVNEIFEAQLEPVHPIDAWARISRRHPTKKLRARRVRFSGSVLSLTPWLIGAGIVIAGLLYISQYGLRLKSSVVRQGNAAVSSLLLARDDLEKFDLAAASDDFSLAAEKFSAATEEMETLGPGLLGLASKIPGLRSLSYGRDLAKSGILISDAGQAVTEALTALGKAGGLLDPTATDKLALGQVFTPLQEAFHKADSNISQAAELIAGIPDDALPEETRGQFIEFKSRMPELEALLGKGNAALSFLLRMTGMDRPKRYLILFQNSSELRPTGGFPGSYGLITFENGRIKDLKADDIYNPDGQIKELVIPPLQLQHITPSWGMRDAAWFIDFATSARKVMEFYRRGGGAAIDGVIAIRPKMIADILEIIGPISLPGYDMVLTADNFLPTIQLEVESKKTPEPKKVIMDLAPVLMQRIASLPSPEWLKVVQIISIDLIDHDAMMYFDDPELQGYVTDWAWDGSVRQGEADYLMVDISNIKGAKTDAVTDTSVKLESRFESGTIVHRLTLTRQHDGGSTPYGFYNKTNYSYVRILVPKGSTLWGIVGNDRPVNNPLMSYNKSGVVIDPDLAALESTYKYDILNGATTYEESGKTGFGFWMKVAPSGTQEVQLEYIIPAKYAASDYRLYVQRQSGLDISNFEFTIQKEGGMDVTSSSPALVTWPDSWRYSGSLERDLELTAKLAK